MRKVEDLCQLNALSNGTTTREELQRQKKAPKVHDKQLELEPNPEYEPEDCPTVIHNQLHQQPLTV